MPRTKPADIASGIEAQKPAPQPGITGDESPAKTTGDEPAAGQSNEKPKPRDPNAADKAELMRQYSHLRDREGLSFDPDLHQWNRTAGEPATTPAGVLKRKPGRKAKNRAAAGESYIAPDTGPRDGAAADGEPGPEPVTEQSLCQTSARTATQLWFGALTAIFGEEGRPSKKYQEAEQLEAALTNHFLMHGRTNFPTHVLVAQVMLATVGRITDSERARESASRKVERLAAWWGRLRERAGGRRQRPAADERERKQRDGSGDGESR